MFVMVIGVLAVAVLADLATNRIPNALILFGLLLGIISRIISKGPPEGIAVIRDIVVAFLIFYVFFILKALGAGDVKLIIVVASFLGVADAAKILATSMVIGALYGCIKLTISIIKNMKVKEGDRYHYSLFDLTDNSKFDKEKDYYKAAGISYMLNNVILRAQYEAGKIVEDVKTKISKRSFRKVPYSPFIMIAALIVWRKLI